MMVTGLRIIELAAGMYECDRCVDKYDTSLRSAAEYLMEISRIDTKGWDLLKLATAFKMVCCPEVEISVARRLFTSQVLSRLKKDAHRYKDKIRKKACLRIHSEMYSAHTSRLEVVKLLVPLIKLSKKAYGDEQLEMTKLSIPLVKQDKRAYADEQAGRGASGHEIGHDRKKICRGFDPVLADQLTEWHTMLSAKRNERQVPPTLAPFDALKRYSSHPLNMTSRLGILSMDIHPSKEIVATGGIDTNTLLFDWPSSQIVCTLTGHSKKIITSLKFVNRNGLFITAGSADKAVRISSSSSSSRDNSWRFYDISTRSCLAQVTDASVQEGYTSTAFHPDGGLILATGTTDGAVKIWDVMKAQSSVINICQHAGPVNAAISFSENGRHLATAAGIDGVQIWDLRKCSNPLCSYSSDAPINAVEFDFNGSYHLAVGGSDARICTVRDFDCMSVKTLTDPSLTEKVTSTSLYVRWSKTCGYFASKSTRRPPRIKTCSVSILLRATR
uniref:Uncharacterized protein n=1 Tax=Avena sativa TaxID=4498 RepID=A0ACD5Y7A6_AVESA